MEGLAPILQGFAVAFQPAALGWCFFGVVLGTLVGILPGLGPAATIALLLPVTLTLNPLHAIIMLAGIYYGSQYGGSTTAILLRIPGESSSVATCYDGHEMAKQGRAGPALGIAALSSFVAGTISVVALMLVAPLVGRFALKFGPAEYFSLMALGLTLVIWLASEVPFKALAMTAAGLLAATIGQDPAEGVERFTFGIGGFLDGLDPVPVFMGLFGVAEVLRTIEKPPGTKNIDAPRDAWPSRGDLATATAPTLRGAVIGFVLGVLPGGGATIASFTAYAAEKRFARNRSQLGRGAIEGVAAPEAANNAAATGAFVPLLTLGIPSNAVMAMLLAALVLHGVRPGPTLISGQSELFFGVIASMYAGNLLLLVLNLPLVGLFVQVLRLPYKYLAPLVLLLCLIGAYGVSGQIADVWVVIAFGAAGWWLSRHGFDPAPFVLGLLLGKSIEENLRLALSLSRGSFAPFVERPISAVLLGLAVAAIAIPSLARLRSKSG